MEHKKEEITTPDDNSGVVCCGVLETLNIRWMLLEETGEKCMPFIYSRDGDIMYRVNHCPSCGTYVRDIVIKF